MTPKLKKIMEDKANREYSYAVGTLEAQLKRDCEKIAFLAGFNACYNTLEEMGVFEALSCWCDEGWYRSAKGCDGCKAIKALGLGDEK